MDELRRRIERTRNQARYYQHSQERLRLEAFRHQGKYAQMLLDRANRAARHEAAALDSLTRLVNQRNQEQRARWTVHLAERNQRLKAQKEHPWPPSYLEAQKAQHSWHTTWQTALANAYQRFKNTASAPLMPQGWRQHCQRLELSLPGSTVDLTNSLPRRLASSSRTRAAAAAPARSA